MREDKVPLKFNLELIFFHLVMLFPITTIIQTYIEVLNKLLIVIIFGILLSLMWKDLWKKNVVFVLVVYATIYIVSAVQTKYPLYNNNMLLYMLILILYYSFCINSTERLINYFHYNLSYIKWIVRLWSLVVGISVFLPSSYSTVENWGDGLYFNSITDGIFRLGPTAVFIMALVSLLMVITKQRKYFIYVFIPMYCMFMGGSRSYLVAGGCAFLLCWYFFCNSNKKFYLSIVPIGVIMILFIMNSSMGDKILTTFDFENSHQSAINTLTNGRIGAWTEILVEWKEENIFRKLFGCGIDFVYGVNGRWAFCDFIEALCSYGIIGLCIYVYSIFKLIYYYIIKGKKGTTGIGIAAIVCMIWFITAFTNLFCAAMCCVFSYPFFLLALNEYQRNFEI